MAQKPPVVSELVTHGSRKRSECAAEHVSKAIRGAGKAFALVCSHGNRAAFVDTGFHPAIRGERVALVGATHCGGEAKSDVGVAAGAGTPSTGGAGPVEAGAGGTVSSSGSGSAGSPASCGGSHSLPAGRPKALACAATPPDTPGASAPACSTDDDCGDGGEASFCLGSKCGLDQCLVDSDCPSGQACRCSDQQGGNIGHTNSCVPTGCRGDADCGTSGKCSPDTSGFCGSLTGYQCHSAADTCSSDADCCGDTLRCGYQPELAHWACVAAIRCNG